ncbi:hypothetical protein EDD85DRAFT_970796 [Armillaria nabsnona]|nr:hypothetical protein EDD85DRAFT_970796 [Armillaria nabsnona]
MAKTIATFLDDALQAGVDLHELETTIEATFTHLKEKKEKGVANFYPSTKEGTRRSSWECKLCFALPNEYLRNYFCCMVTTIKLEANIEDEEFWVLQGSTMNNFSTTVDSLRVYVSKDFKGITYHYAFGATWLLVWLFHPLNLKKSLGNVISPITVVAGGKDKKKELAYGADLLRLWIASVEYWNDVPLGTHILNQTAESLRKIRNTARFLLGNIGDIYEQDNEDAWEDVREHMGLADRYMINELQKFEAECATAYVAYNFPKDNVYANALNGYERHATVFVLKEREDGFAIKGFTEDDMKAVKKDSDDMAMLMQEVRPVVTSLLEQAREQKYVKLANQKSLMWPQMPFQTCKKQLHPSRTTGKSGLLKIPTSWSMLIGSRVELRVYLVLPEDFTAKHFIVSRVTVMDEGSLGTASPEWIYIRSLSILGEGFSNPASTLGSEESHDIAIRIRPAMREKCPRCWTFAKEAEDILCERCADVTQDMD